jgi:hypothetical protein
LCFSVLYSSPLCWSTTSSHFLSKLWAKENFRVFAYVKEVLFGIMSPWIFLLQVQHYGFHCPPTKVANASLFMSVQFDTC